MSNAMVEIKDKSFTIILISFLTTYAMICDHALRKKMEILVKFFVSHHTISCDETYGNIFYNQTIYSD